MENNKAALKGGVSNPDFLMNKHLHLPADSEDLVRWIQQVIDHITNQKPSYSRIADRLQAIHQQGLESLARRCGEIARQHHMFTNKELELEVQKLAQQLRLTPPRGSRSSLVVWLKSVHFAITGEVDEHPIEQCLQVLSRDQAPEHGA